jgi:hypothetical protein
MSITSTSENKNWSERPNPALGKKKKNRKKNNARQREIQRSLRAITMERNLPVGFGQAGVGDHIEKRMTYAGIITTSALGTIGLFTPNNGLVQSLPATEWASFAARYQQYRVREFQMTLMPRYVVNYWNGVGVTGGTLVATADYIGTALPTSYLQILSDEYMKLHSTNGRIHMKVTSARNPNAILWNPTSAVMPPANTMGVAFAGATLAAVLPPATVYFDYVYEWIVEFRGSQ